MRPYSGAAVSAEAPGRRAEGRTRASALAEFREAWRDRSLTMLLVMQVVTIFALVPASANGLPVPAGLVALLLLVAMAVTIFVANAPWALAGGVAALLLDATLALYQEVHGGLAADIAFNTASLATFAMLGVVVGVAVFRPGHFTNHRIRGTVVLYINLGLIFAFLHRIVAEVLPGSYSNLPSVEQRAAFRAALDYYSFATLTSVGYGDIVPVAPLARSMSTLEAAVGQLLPTLLIGRVLSLTMKDE